ncbi:hypothetical protein [Clostridium frigidicarnis]|uniref:Uncharacterized protein n=1 Tax=Clostridium frigidicarnis TaxID=84698 RepID=A0A1I0V3C5_9CLOT|nr:hypothetical protein [Clostridium frigidicarnis]SFA70633.1 hypothetical protein SAMN04488528_1001121 [Clostridium frigidicarnis]
MESYSDFKKEIGLKGVEIEKLTGYTKQGLHYAFNMIDEGKQPAKRFLVCINCVIEKEFAKEIERHEKRIRELKELKEILRRVNNERD